jgi:hypothetical protein
MKPDKQLTVAALTIKVAINRAVNEPFNGEID